MSNFFYEYVDGDVSRVDLEEGEKLPVKGKRLTSLLKDNKVFKKKEIYFITEQLLDILGKMRSVFPPVLHKNINPSNIIIKKAWEIALIGFNGSKPIEDYMAPEVLSLPTPKSDLYSVGKVLIDLSGSENLNKDFKKFVGKMIESNPNNRFKDINTAKLIFEKIEDNSIKERDWNMGNTGNMEASGDYSNISSQEKDIRNEFNESLDDLDDAIFDQRRNYNRRGRHGKESWLGLLLIIPIMIFVSYMNNNDDDCDTAPRGYYNDDECNLHLKSPEARKSDIMNRNKKDKELRDKWKKSGVTRKIGGE